MLLARSGCPRKAESVQDRDKESAPMEDFELRSLHGPPRMDIPSSGDRSKTCPLFLLPARITMKAFTTLGDGIAALKVVELPLPAPESHQVLVKMTAAALNYRDLLLTNGVRSLKPLAPRIPVSDGVGVVVGIGDRVT